MTLYQIIVVEDETIVALDLKSRLTRLGYHVPAVAATGPDAIALTEKHRPDLILMDIRLQGDMDGVEAVKIIQRRVKVPVIYVTALSGADAIKRAKSTGPVGYLFKPFAEQELLALIKTALHSPRH
jgi:CheY-like chemotaxis protein